MDNDKSKKKKGYTVYVPPNTEPNIENMSSDPPRTRYDNRRGRFNVEEVKKIVGGEYGQSN